MLVGGVLGSSETQREPAVPAEVQPMILGGALQPSTNERPRSIGDTVR